MQERAENGNTQVSVSTCVKMRTTSDKINQSTIYLKLSFLLQTSIHPKYHLFTLLDFFLTENVRLSACFVVQRGRYAPDY